MEIIDNINHLLGDDLKKMLKPDTKLKIAASCFSIYAFEALKKELSKIDSLEFIFTSPTFVPKAPMQQYASVQNKDTDTVYMPLHGFRQSIYAINR